VEAALTGHWRKFPLKTQKKQKNALTGPAHRPGEKGEKKQKKNTGGKLQN
jgi:hypothetical protein